MQTTQEYAPGRFVDLVGDGDSGVALLWHGRGVDSRTAMRPLTDRVAAGDVLAVAADWSSESADGGRTDLLGSLRFARENAERLGRDPSSVVLVGWSLGGTAALGVARHAKRLGIALGGVVLVGPGDGSRVIDPISGAALPSAFPPGASRCDVDLVYGEHDPLATPDLVSGLELRLRAAGWSTSLHSVDADHAGVVGARYDERTERYLPSTTDASGAAVQTVADIVVAAATSSS
ncbi:hypothetical protein [Aeromicrobium sp.]|uniref:alpha/beta hydrolase n=1 Tax=Aeromicrobium sp. TaxID=1871063 RepID=UPI0030BB608C